MCGLSMPKKILSRDDRTTYREGSFLLFVIKLIHFLGFFFGDKDFQLNTYQLIILGIIHYSRSGILKKTFYSKNKFSDKN